MFKNVLVGVDGRPNGRMPSRLPLSSPTPKEN